MTDTPRQRIAAYGIRQITRVLVRLDRYLRAKRRSTTRRGMHP